MKKEIRIVQAQNKFAVQVVERGWFYENIKYADLKTQGCYWSDGSCFISDCWDSYERAEFVALALKPIILKSIKL